MLSNPLTESSMADRKATFAKRQRETELKDRAREKEARRVARRANPQEGKGPPIAWDEAVRATESAPVDPTVSLNPTDDSATSAPPPAPVQEHRDPRDPRSQASTAPSSSGPAAPRSPSTNTPE
jgi:hypothetical protein